MIAFAVTRSDVLLTLHILAAVVAFGGALGYPLWFRLIRDGTPEQRAFSHAAQARLGKFLIAPAILVVFATGAYLASDADVWGEGWVVISTVILTIILFSGWVSRATRRTARGRLRGSILASTWSLSAASSGSP